MKKHIFQILITVLILFYACEKESIQIDNKFTFKYRFYNEGDTSLKRVILRCTTCYPLENETSWIVRVKWRETDFYDENHLWDYDSLIVETDMKVYPSCFYKYDISLEFFDAEGRGYFKVYSRIDTIRTQNNESIKFSWTKDSTIFERIY